ncbi:MAG: hypothetical protein ABI668_07400 [Sphingorhabdus sp.]
MPVISLLPLLLAATGIGHPEMIGPQRPVATRVAVAAVRIIRAETVDVQKAPRTNQKMDRQYRQRDSVPMVEFY